MEEEYTFQNTTIDDYLKDIMFNVSNTEENSRILQLEAKLRFGLQPLSEIHPQIRELEDNFFCLIWGFKKKCGSCGELITKPVYCCDKKHCPECNAKYSNKRGSIIYQTFAKFNTDYMVHKVLTFPENYFEGILEPSQIKKQIKKLALEFLEQVYGKYFNGILKVHSWSTKKPLDKPHWHVHILMSDRIYKPIYQHTLVDGHAQDFVIDYALDEIKVYSANLDRERALWQKVLSYSGEVNIYHSYSNKPKKKVHWCKYITRDSIYDINKVLLERGKSYRMNPKEIEQYRYQTTYKKHSKSLHWFGEFQDLKRGKLYFILRLPRINEKLNFLDICPLCETPICFKENYDYARINDKDIFAIQIEEQEYELFIKRKTKEK